jgi:hypothetical protein
MPDWIEAGMASHHVARELVALGHQVKQVPPSMWTAPHVIRLTTITLRHFAAAERAPSTTPKPVVSRCSNKRFPRKTRHRESCCHRHGGALQRAGSVREGKSFQVAQRGW